MTEIVFNQCHGGFGLSAKAIARYSEITGNKVANQYNISRHDPALVQVVKELGKEANGGFANLAIEEIPVGTAYRITEYDGSEEVEKRDEIYWEIAK